MLLPLASYRNGSSALNEEIGGVFANSYFFSLKQKQSNSLASVLFSSCSAGIIKVRVSIREPYFACDL